jgi:hypothetical protein
MRLGGDFEVNNIVWRKCRGALEPGKSSYGVCELHFQTELFFLLPADYFKALATSLLPCIAGHYSIFFVFSVRRIADSHFMTSCNSYVASNNFSGF